MSSAVLPVDPLVYTDNLRRVWRLKPCVPQALNPPINPTLVVDGAGLDKVKKFLYKQLIFGFDIETNVVPKVFERRIRTTQVGDKNEQYVIDLLAFTDGAANALIVGQEGKGKFPTYIHPGIRRVLETLRPFLDSNLTTKVGASLEFEYTTLKWCFGLRSWNFYDVQLAEKVLYCGLVGFMESGFWALDDLAARYCGLLMDKSQQKSFDLETPLTEQQVVYAALDTRIPLAIRLGQLPKLAKDGLERAVEIENNAIPAFGDMHLNGLLLDVEKFEGLLNQTRIEHVQNIASLDEFLIPVCGMVVLPPHDLDTLEKEWRECEPKVRGSEKRKTARERYQAAAKEVKTYFQNTQPDKKGKIEWEGRAKINHGSPAQVLDALRELGFGPSKLKSSDDDDLKKLAGTPVIDALRDFRETEKILKSYSDFVADHINPTTGRIHSRFIQLGAATGRAASQAPNVFNILKGKDWRSCFIAPPGRKVITADYNGCELRILADMSCEPLWQEAFRKGWDVHSLCAELVIAEKWLAAQVAGCAYYEKDHSKCDPDICPQHDKLRGPFKNINFGIAYGISAYKLSGDLGITREEAEALLDKFKRTFPRLWAYLERSGQNAKMNLEARTASGRRRQWKQPTWERAKAQIAKKLKREPTQSEVTKQLKATISGIEREGKNDPIQGTNADMIKQAIGCGFDPDGKPYLWHVLEPKYDAKLVNVVYDETVTESPDQHAPEVLEVVLDAMSRAGSEFVKSVPMPAEGRIHPYWKK